MPEMMPKCAQCGRTSEEVPLLVLKYKDTKSWICPQHLPILIHKPQNLVGKLPGVENLSSEGHNHH
jgi:hypothetical protein